MKKSITNNSLRETGRICRNPGSAGDICLIFKVLHCARRRSTLALLVAAILADDAHHSVAPDDLAVAADTLDRCTYFHVTPPSS
jgi:hypothetical protein